MKQPRKISLADAQKSGDTRLVLYCMNHRIHYGGCFHQATWPLSEAIARWGGDMSLSDLPVKCSQCGARNFDARTDHPRGIGGKPL